MSPTVTRNGHGPCHHLHVLEEGRMSQVERQEVPQSVKWGSWFLVGAPFARIPGLGTGTLGVELSPHWEVRAWASSSSEAHPNSQGS